MVKKTLIFDTECYKNFWYLGIKRLEDGKRVGFEYSKRTNFEIDRDHIRMILKRNLMVGFNSLPYDLPMIAYMLTGVSLEELKEASDLIIKNGLKYWQVEEALGIAVPKKIDHIDLFETNPAVKHSLKTLNGRLHGERLQDLPFHESKVLTFDEMEITADYCLHSDLDATENLFNQLKEPIDLRIALGAKYKRDFRSKSDAQIGESIVKIEAEEKLNKRLQKPTVVATKFRYHAPDFIEFQTPKLQHILEVIKRTDIYVDRSGKVQNPEEFQDFHVQFGDMEYTVGIGGLHSKEKRRALCSDDEYVLVDADVASQYPSIIMKLGLFPKAVGKVFLDIYGNVISDRLRAKKRAKEIKDELSTNLSPLEVSQLKHELDQMAVIDKGGKIMLNGVYGKLGSAFSILYAPHLMVAVTLTGQLTLLMLIEEAERHGIHVVSGNTDGVVFLCPRKFYQGIDHDRLIGGKLKQICDWWEDVTSFKLEFAEYRAIYNRDVNAYFAIKANGKAKRKGFVSNHWHPDSPDYDPLREQMKKNPKMTVCGDAALEHILHGTPIEKFIREYRDIRGFLTLINATGGATWRGKYLGKVVRYIWSTDGDPIIKVKPNEAGTLPKVPETDGSRPVMTLPKEFPVDIDYDRYVQTTEEILRNFGFLPMIERPKRTLYEKVIKQWVR